MHKILVPTDFSKCAANAMKFALEIAARTGASIHIVNVIYPAEGVENNVFNAVWVDEYFSLRQYDLKKWVARFQKNKSYRDVTITGSVEIGFMVSFIKMTAEEQKADLIVMGTTGATGLRGAFLGSIAAGVVSAVSIPVLAVPEKAVFRSPAAYVLATDFDVRIDKNSRKVMLEILKLQNAGIHVLNVLDTLGQQPDKTLEPKIRRLFPDTPCQFHYLHEINVPRAVNNFIETIGAQGLIVVSHRHSFLQKLMSKSVSRALTQRIRVPVLALHDAEKQ